MRLARLLLTCILGLGVAIQGYAGVRIMDSCCPMQQQASVHHDMSHMDGMDMSAMGMDVQQPDNPVPDNAPHCGGHLGCQSAGIAPIAIVFVPAIQRTAPQEPRAVVPVFHSHVAFLLWRPPALV